MAEHLCYLHTRRCRGGLVRSPSCILLTAGPVSLPSPASAIQPVCAKSPACCLLAQAGGKTSLISQVVMRVLQLGAKLVPIPIKVQELQRSLLKSREAFTTAWNWIDTYLRLQHNEAVYGMLRQAMMSRRALIILDGLDEGGVMRKEIERHVSEVLAPQGFVMLITSRPVGIDEERFLSFQRLSLAPLTTLQQEQAIMQRVGEGAGHELLFAYLRNKVPIDTETKLRVTANPLMLSMVVSIFEIRRGVGMPRTVAELYANASDAMLALGGAAVDKLRKLLQCIFFEAHVAQQRIIEDLQLDEAALSIEQPMVLQKIRERALTKPFELILPTSSFTPGHNLGMGHVVDVVSGEHRGKRGVITSSASQTGVVTRVAFPGGTVHTFARTAGFGSVYGLESQLKSSGLNETEWLNCAMAAPEADLRAECEKRLSIEMCDALCTLRERVAQDGLPLLSMLQAEPLQVQSSHLSFQVRIGGRDAPLQTRNSLSPLPSGGCRSIALSCLHDRLQRLLVDDFLADRSHFQFRSTSPLDRFVRKAQCSRVLHRGSGLRGGPICFRSALRWVMTFAMGFCTLPVSQTWQAHSTCQTNSEATRRQC